MFTHHLRGLSQQKGLTKVSPFLHLNPSFGRDKSHFAGLNHFVMKSDFVGSYDGFNFTCSADFIRVQHGFHRILYDFIENEKYFKKVLTFIERCVIIYKHSREYSEMLV